MSHSDRSGESAYTPEVAASYENDRRGESYWELEQAYISTVAAHTPPGSRVLDIPVGTGRFLEIYQARGLRVLGLDISPAMLTEAAHRVHSRDIELATGDATRIEAPDRAFDLVVCWRLLHLLPATTVDRVAAELLRVSAGHLHVQAYVRDRSYWWLRLRKFAHRLLRSRGGAHARGATPWSHIRSYAHPEKALLASFANQGARLEHCETLGTDGALRVRAYRFSRR